MPIAKKTINPDFLEQLKSNTKKDTPVTETPAVAAEPEVKAPQTARITVTQTKPLPAEKTPAASAEPQQKYADVMNVRLSKGRRNEIKAFCTNCGITVTQYIESSFEFLAEEVAAGRISISKGGIKKVE